MKAKAKFLRQSLGGFRKELGQLVRASVWRNEAGTRGQAVRAPSARVLESALALMCALALTGLESGLGQQPPATIQFSSPAYNVAEDARTALITVLRTGDIDTAVTVDYATSDGTAKAGADYAAQSATLRFAAGETNKTLTIAILDDGVVEGDETLNVELSGPTGGASLGLQKTALLTIGDNELRARLLDISFNPDVSGTSASSFAVQNDGKILSTASFYSSDGSPANAKIVRLNSNGSLDAAFNFIMEQTGQASYTTLVLAPT